MTLIRIHSKENMEVNIGHNLVWQVVRCEWQKHDFGFNGSMLT